MDVVKILANIHTSKANGNTPLTLDTHLMTALTSSCNNTELARLFIEYGADVNCQDNYGRTALSLMCYHGYIDNVKLLFETGADVKKMNTDEKTALFGACEHGNLNLVKLVIKNGADINHKDNNGNTPLIKSSSCKNQEVARLLIKKGADIHVQNKVELVLELV
eukprot:GHVR01029183.1.p1 GENE.GHVR01029183.1~~GHVR01029183.1.p1  ORF type:complete len:164 (-),score=8.12 GHVR01029183.1:91-582(-)